MAFRFVAKISGKFERFLLNEGDNLVGSGRDCDIRLQHASVSRQHARVSVDGDRLEVLDLESKNGTRVDGEKISAAVLKAGAGLSFGAVGVRVESMASDDALPAIDLSAHRPEGNSAGAENRTTLISGPAETFVLEHLPLLLTILGRSLDRHEVAQAIGQTLFAGLPCNTVHIGPEEGDAVVFEASRAETAEPADSTLKMQSSGFEFAVCFASDQLKGQYEALVVSVIGLMELAVSGPRTRSDSTQAWAGVTAPLPTPPTVAPSMLTLFERLARVARGSLPILISGESGTGKEVLARFAHRSSPIAAGPFLALNCASLPTDLLESELFGIEKGVATGVDARPGKFELAKDGTLFLDEIGDMALETQAKILRVLQSRELYRIGARKPIPISCRIISATNRDLSAMQARGEFREDLYYRLAGWEVELPPLRHRIADIPNLAAHFLLKSAEQAGVRVRGISKAAVEALMAFHWPGNVRQLEQEMARSALFLEDGELLDCARLSEEITRERPPAPRFSLEAVLRRVEADEITMALGRESTIDEAAAALGVSRATLYRRIKALGIIPPKDEPEK